MTAARGLFRVAVLLAALALCAGPALAAGKPPSRPAAWSVPRIEALLDRALRDLREKKTGPAEPLVRQAVEGCRVLGLPGDHPTVARVALALYARHRPDREIPKSSALGAGALSRIARLESGDARLLLLRRACAVLDSESLAEEGLEDAYDLTILLLESKLFDPARKIVARAVRAADDQTQYSGRRWAMLFLEPELRYREGDLAGARQRFEALRAEVAKAPHFSPYAIVPYWLLRCSQRILEIDTARCDTARIDADLRAVLAAERSLLDDTPQEVSEVRFRSVATDLQDEDHLFTPILQCGIHEPAILRTTVTRALLHREIWRYRPLLMQRARSLDGTKEAAARLVYLRRARAEARLRSQSSEPADVVDTEFEIESLETGLARDTQASSGIFDQAIEDAWPRLTRALGEDGALVGYLPAAVEGRPRRLVAFVVDGTGRVSWSDLGDGETVDRRLSGAWIRLSAAPFPDTKDALRQAGKSLYDPIAGFLAGKRRISLLASGQVRFVPWSALVDADSRFLGQRFVAVWIQSLEDLTDAPPAPSGRPEAVLAAPSYEPTAADSAAPDLADRAVAGVFRDLPGARKELQAVREILSGHGFETRVLAGEPANERSFRSLKSPGILHVAAHGFSLPEDATLVGRVLTVGSMAYMFWPNKIGGVLEPDFLRTGLALSGANRGIASRGDDDGLLTASEAADLDLTETSLVVLSGCGTASPTLQDVGGAYDLALGFRMAGAASVVGSLWPVDDGATFLLMSDLYERLARGDSVSEALWHAKETLRSTPAYAHPTYWAGFEILGKGEVRFAARP